MISPILIATKGRAGMSATIEKIIEDNLAAVLFVEPQDEAAYVKAYGKKKNIMYCRLAKDSGGIAFVRQTILDFARDKGFKYYWTLDDDIRDTYKIVKGKTIKVPMRECLEGAELLLRQIKNLAIGGLEYSQFAWSARKQFVFNSFCEVATFVNVKNSMLANYRGEVNLKEDRDFVLQNLVNGFVSARTSWWAFSAPKNGSNKGGLYDEYRAGKEAEAVENFCKVWPGIVRPITKKDGRCDAKIDWASFKNAPVFNDSPQP